MSTQINVTVGGGGLVDQARRNQEEARWKLTERERWERSQRAEATVSGDAVLGGGRAGFQFRPDEPAANRRPQGGTTGMAWVAQEHNAGTFSAASFWGLEFNSSGRPLIEADGSYRLSVGSGDGTMWTECVLSFPGIPGWSEGVRDFYGTSVSNGGLSYGSYYATIDDPVGKTYTSRRFLVDDSRIHYLLLPAGNSGAVLIVAGRACGSWLGVKWTVMRSSPIVWAGTTFYEFHTTNDVARSDVRDDIRTADVKAYFITQNTVREINVPTVLRTRLDALLLDGEFTYAVDIDYGYDEHYTIYYPTGPDAYWYSEEDGVRRRKYEEYIDAPLYASYGAHPTLMAIPGQWPQIQTDRIGTPARYPALSNPVGFFAGVPFPADYTSTHEYAYAEGRTALRTAGAPAPSHVVTFDARRNDYIVTQNALWNNTFPRNGDNIASIYKDPARRLSGIGIVRTNTPPDDYYDTLPQDGAWREVKFLPFSPDRETPYNTTPVPAQFIADRYELFWHYDWGEPAYCRQQLLALGFTPADLTP